MNSEKTIWGVLIALALAFIAYKATIGGGMGEAYVEADPVEMRHVIVPAELGGDGEKRKWVRVDSEESLDYDMNSSDVDPIGWTRWKDATPKAYAEAQAADENQTAIVFSWTRTMGIWIGAFFTLSIFSFLYKDNPFYKIAEAVVVGVSAAYWMTIGWWSQIVPNLLGNLFPEQVKATVIPGLEQTFDWVYIFPFILSIMLLWRLSPKGGWIARWPMAFIIGVFCGLKLIGFLHADFLSQIRNSIAPVLVWDDGGFNGWESVRNLVLVIGVLSCLVYFFFSVEHKGMVGRTAKLGIWFLMVTFGAAFGYTVMGRIALLAIRLEFLFDDWLWLIDPAGKRAALLLFM